MILRTLQLLALDFPVSNFYSVSSQHEIDKQYLAQYYEYEFSNKGLYVVIRCHPFQYVVQTWLMELLS